MEKRNKRQAKGRRGSNAGQRRAANTSAMNDRQPMAMSERLRRCCLQCVFCIRDLSLCIRTLMSGFPIGGLCANHADTPGRIRPIPGRPCCNFRAKPYRVEPPEPPNDKIAYIPLTRGLHAIVDVEDHQWLSKHKWHASPATGHSTVYAKRSTRHGSVFMHRMIMKPPEGMVVDHINGNGLDNRRCNLRICTPTENSRNRRKHADGKSRFIGVSPWGKKWQAAVGRHYLGLFDDEVEAAKARDRKALELYGEHAWLNFPQEVPRRNGQ